MGLSRISTSCLGIYIFLLFYVGLCHGLYKLVSKIALKINIAGTWYIVKILLLVSYPKWCSPSHFTWPWLPKPIWPLP